MVFRSLLILAALGSAAAAMAGVVSVGSIDGFATEGFESFQNRLSAGYNVYPELLFGGDVMAEYTDEGYGGVITQGNWGLETAGGEWSDVIPHGGSQFLTAAGAEPGGPRGSVRLSFLSGGVYQFGGWFSDYISEPSRYGLTADDVKTQFEFYVSDGLGGETLYDTAQVSLLSESGELHWAGFSSDVELTSVVVAGYDIPMDDLVVGNQAVPEPASMAALGFGALALLRRRKRA